MNLLLQISETNETNLQVLKCLHSMFIKEDHIAHWTNEQFFVSCCQNESLQGGVSFSIICGYSEECTDSTFVKKNQQYFHV